MNAKELRLNNLIFDDNGDITKVFVMSDYGSCEINDDIMSDRYKPILLTEEWLAKFGFEKCDSPTEQGYTNGKCFMFQNSIGKFNFCLLKFGDFFKRIEYVHQLQNLYFALTGEELTIKTLENENSKL